MLKKQCKPGWSFVQTVSRRYRDHYRASERRDDVKRLHSVGMLFSKKPRDSVSERSLVEYHDQVTKQCWKEAEATNPDLRVVLQLVLYGPKCCDIADLSVFVPGMPIVGLVVDVYHHYMIAANTEVLFATLDARYADYQSKQALSFLILIGYVYQLVYLAANGRVTRCMCMTPFAQTYLCARELC